MIRNALIWIFFGAALAVPVGLIAGSPYLAYRDAVYVASGVAGAVGLAVLLVQPVLMLGLLPGLSPRVERRIHRMTGGALLAAVILHVAGLWLTSPPDVVDALTFTSPTPFSVWGVLAMWGVFATAGLVAVRRRLALTTWRRMHLALAVLIAGGTIVHAVLIEGTMETVSKVALCALVGLATVAVVLRGRRSVRRSAGAAPLR